MTSYNDLRDGQEFFANGYKKGYGDAKKEFDRPQGEWINEYWEDAYQKYYHTCDVCKTEIVKTAYDNYCSCCGAKMRKGEEE